MRNWRGFCDFFPYFQFLMKRFLVRGFAVNWKFHFGVNLVTLFYSQILKCVCMTLLAWKAFEWSTPRKIREIFLNRSFDDDFISSKIIFKLKFNSPIKELFLFLFCNVNRSNSFEMDKFGIGLLRGQSKGTLILLWPFSLILYRFGVFSFWMMLKFFLLEKGM